MQLNVGSTDRFIRIVVGLALLLAPLLNVPAVWSSQALSYTSMGVGLILFGTALVGFCPLYRLIGVSTCKT